MSEVFKYGKCPTKFFIGRKREKEQIKELLRQIAGQENISHGLIIHGREGIGKKSFLSQVEELASDFGIIRYDVPFTSNEGYFDYISNELDEMTKPVEKRKPVAKPGKKAPLIKRSYEIVDKTKYIDTFLKQLLKKIPNIVKNIRGKKFNKKGIVIISNLFERFIILNNDSALDILKALVDGIRNDIKNPNLPVLFVIGVWEKYYQKVRYVLKDFHEIGLPTLNSTEAKELIEKRADAAGIKITDEIKENLIRQSGGIPLSLVYNTAFLYQNRGDAREIGKEIWFKAEGGVKEGFGRELNNLGEKERKILQAFAMESANFADANTIARAIGATVEETKPLLEKMLNTFLSKEGDIYYITLDSFWIYLRGSLGDIAVDAQARGLIKITMNLAENGRLIEDFEFQELERIRSDALSAGLVSAVEHIANGYYDIAVNYYKYEYYNEVYKFILLSGESLVKVNEKEKAANILEDFADKFIEKSLLDYARDTLINAIEINKSLGETKKVSDLTVKLAQICEQKADICIEEQSYPLARANYIKSKIYYEQVKANDDLINIQLKAAKNFISNKEYFYAWQFYTNISNTYIALGQKDKANDILDQSIKQFKSAGLTDFVDKLTLHKQKILSQGGSV